MMGSWRTALWLEMLSVLRMREVYTFGFLPAALFLPGTLALVTVVVSFSSDTRLAIPATEPAGFELVEALEDDFDVLRVDDPEAAFADGRAEVAIVSWRVEGADADVAVDVLAASPKAVKRVRGSLRRGLRDELDARIEEAAGTPVRDRVLATMARAPPLEVDFRQLMWLVFTFLAAYLGCFLLPVRCVAERLSGTLEALVVTATPVGVVYGARVLVGAVLFVGIAALPLLSTLVVLGTGDLDFYVLDLFESFSVVLLVNALFLVCGLAANSVRLALYFASYLIMFAMPVAAIPLFFDLAAVPLLGFAEEGPWLLQGGRILATVALACLVVWGASWFATGERALPPGEADE